MKTQLTVSLMVLSLVSCHILKKDKQTLRKLNQKEEIQLLEHRHTLSQQKQLMLIDSSHNDFTLLLWPKGKFTFSVANGFEGEAEKVIVLGKNTRLKTLELKSEIKKDSLAHKATYSKEKENHTTIQKTKRSTGFNWSWLLLVAVLFVCYRLLTSASLTDTRHNHF